VESESGGRENLSEKRSWLPFVLIWIAAALSLGGLAGLSTFGMKDGSGTTPAPTPRPTPTFKICQKCEEDLVVGTPDTAVHMYLFSDRLCGECVAVEEEVLPPLQEAYGSRLSVERRDVEGSSEAYNLLRALERRYGVTHGEMPVIFIGEEVLSGEQEARQGLPQLVERYLAQGGVALPQAPALTPRAPVSGDAALIHVAYFYQTGCRACDRVRLDLDQLTQRYPGLVVHAFDVRERAALCEWLGERAGLPEESRLTAPVVFVGGEALIGENLQTGNLEALVARYVDDGAEPVWEAWASNPGDAASRIISRFRSLSLPMVLAAGLVDGLNPCAFATLVFFVSYLAFTGRQGREVLASGAAFTLGVFLTYLAVGFGLLRFLAKLPFLDAASRWVYGLTAVLCLFLAAGNLYDWWQARRGQADEMRLKLPTRLRRWINRTIREGAGMEAFVPVTFLTGMVISIIELACTGQVYLPTIVFVLGVPEMQAQAGLYLVLYNLMFILPLVVVFVLIMFGTTSQQLRVLIHRHTAKVKLATAALFLLLAGWLVTALA
jgi:cytochrome c biogenesis protein CcdA